MKSEKEEPLAWGKRPAAIDEREFLGGPLTRVREFFRALGIFVEFIQGFRCELHLSGGSVE